MKTVQYGFLFLLLDTTLLAQSQPPAPPAKTSVAVYQIKAAGSEASLAVALTALLGSQLTPSPKLRVIEEAMLKTVMERQGQNASDACDDTSCQVEIGKLVKAQKLVMGNLAKLGTKYILSIKVVDVAQGTTDFSAEDKCACSDEDLDQLVAVAAIKIRNHFGENLPIPALPQAQALPTANPNVGAQLAAPGTGRASPAPTNQQFQEFHPTGAKGGPMVLVSDFKFYIDKFEVTNQDYQECVSAAACKEANRDYQECVSAAACKEAKKKSGFDGPKQPVVFVNQDDARIYCQWAGKRLPKEQEWQEAAQGTDGRTYAWGNQEPNCTLANYTDCGVKAALLVGSKPAGASPYGALDMTGNVWEWVEEKGVFRGGGWDSYAALLRVTLRSQNDAPLRLYNGGFRCARDGS